jgi:hypothetical protein
MTTKAITPLRQRMIEDMQARNLAPHTQRAYLQHVSQLARHFHKSPELLGPTEIRAFQLYLARKGNSSPARSVQRSPVSAFSTTSRCTVSLWMSCR